MSPSSRVSSNLQTAFLRSAVCVAALGTLLDPALGQRGATPEPSADALRSESPAAELVQRWLDTGRIAGAQARVRRGDEVLLELCLGSRSIDLDSQLPEDTIYRIYSMSKPITVAAALILVDRGVIELDQDVATILPEFEALRAYAPRNRSAEEHESGLRTEPLDQPMTVRDLMRHTSGLTYGFFAMSPVDRLVRECDPLNPESSLEDLVAKLAKIPLKHQPGTTWEYGLSTDVLGRVIEVAAEQPFDEFLRTEIFEPLGMVDTGFSVSQRTSYRVSMVHERRGGSLRTMGQWPSDRRPGLSSGGGGLLSTLSDYERFVDMLTNGGVVQGDDEDSVRRILSEDSVREMTSNQLDGQRLSGMVSVAVPGGFGLGVSVADEEHSPEGGPGEGTWGWAGAAGTFFWVDPSRNLSGVFMVQNWQDSSLGPLFRKAFYEGLE
ncbi:MAG: serine hydrolase domain-containing protein [Planctomycetota bacterium]